MIAFVYGTTGELIKIAPVMKRLEARRIPFMSLTTAQQADQLPEALSEFRLPPPDCELAQGARGHDLRSHRDVPPWLGTVCLRFAKQYTSIRGDLTRGPGRPLVLVHGDTMTTFLGALMGRLLRVRVAHLEAGLRSGDLRNPFPEELHRRLVTRLADIHFAPNAAAVDNLGERHGKVVRTSANTVIDSLELVEEMADGGLQSPRDYGIVSVHRSELIDDEAAFTRFIHYLRDRAEDHPMIFVNHSVTDQRLRDYQLLSCFGDEFRLLPKQSYFSFVRLLRGSSFVITDSGGLQEECAHLGIACAVHRLASERPDGLGANVLLTGGDLSSLDDFLRDPAAWRRAPKECTASPANEVVEYLIAAGFADPGA